MYVSDSGRLERSGEHAMTETVALYFNLDLTLTRMEKEFDAITVETLHNAGVADEQIEPELLTWLFFDHFTAFESEPRTKAFADYFDQYDVNADPTAAAAQYDETELETTEPVVDDLEGTLETLGEAYQVGVLTRGMADLQQAKIEKLGIEDVLDDVVISEAVERHKEDGGLFEVAEERIEADRYVYFSNSKSDIEAAERAEWDTVEREFDELGDEPIAAIREDIS